MRRLLRRLTGGGSSSENQLRTAGEVAVAVHDVDDLRAVHANWDALSAQQKLVGVRQVAPTFTEWTTNTTVDGLHNYIVDNLDGSQSVNENASHLALGDGDGTPSSSNSSLNSEVHRTTVTEHIDDGKDLLTSTFIDSSSGNGNTFREVGLFTASSGGYMLNHSLITEVEKDNSKSITVQVTLKFRTV